MPFETECQDCNTEFALKIATLRGRAWHDCMRDEDDDDEDVTQLK